MTWAPFDDSYLRAALEMTPGRILKKVVGANWDVDSTAFEDIWPGGGVYDWPTTAQQIEAISTDADDTYQGDGARVVRCCFLKDDWTLERDIDIALNGTSASDPTTNSYIRLLDAHIIRAGTYGGANEGTITLRGASDQKVFGKFAVQDEHGVGQIMASMFTIPAGMTGYFLGGTVYVDAAQPATVRVNRRIDAHLVTAPFGAASQYVPAFGVEGPFAIPMKGPSSPIPEKTDLWASAKGDSANSRVSIEYELLLVENPV